MIEAVLARWNGRHEDTFANSANYKHIHSRSRTADTDPQVFMYVNPIDLVKAAITMTDPNNQMAAMAMRSIPMFGLDKLKSLGGGMSFSVGEYDAISKMVAQLDMPPTGSLEIFTFPVTSLKPPIWVSNKAAGYDGANWDFQKAYRAVAATVDKIPIFGGEGAFEKKIDELASDENGPQIHLKKDFVDNLTGKIHFLTDQPDADNPLGARMLFALGTKDEKKMNAVLDKLSKTPGFPGTTRVFQGVTIYEIPLGAAFGGGGNSIGVSVAHGNLMIASDVTMLEEAVRANYGNNSLANSAEYKKYASRFPAKTSMISFARQETQIKAIYRMLRSGGVPAAAIPIEIDFSKLPPFEKIKQYFAATGGYTIPDENGFTTISFSLK